MKKLLLVLAVAFTGVLNAQNVTETKSVNKIVETFQSINGMILSASKLDQLYLDLSKLTFVDEVLFLKTSYFNNTNVLNMYGNNNVFKTTNFLNDQQDKLVTVEIDLSNVTSSNRLKTNTQINISIFYRNDLGELTQNYLEVHIRNGLIIYVNELDNTPAEASASYFNAE
jgi:hypothetical protein